MKVFYEELKRLTMQKLMRTGLLKKDAERIADCYATADLYGVSSHGVAILPTHLKRLAAGGYNLEPTFPVVKKGGSFQVVDGENSIGVLSAMRCVELALKGAKENGLFAVNSFHNNTLGPAFYYALEMAKKGFIGITLCNSPAQMTAPNGKSKLLGTNPLAIAIPNGNKPIVLDMATSAVAKSKIKQMKENGESIPLGWALDENFQPTQDAGAALKGYILPMAGFKGYGLALMIDILAGVLSGAGYLDNVGRFYSPDFACMNVGFSFIAIDPRQMYGEGFEVLMQSYINHIEADERVDGSKEIALPGFDRFKNKENNEKNGIEIDDGLYEFLKDGEAKNAF